MFRNFSIWENEINELIERVSAETEISKSHIDHWLHSDGPCLGVKTQEEGLAKYAHTHITPTLMEEIKRDGFHQMRDAYLKTLSCDETLKNKIAGFFAEFIEHAIKRHKDFYQIQTAITNQINQFQRENPKATLEQKVIFSIQQYEEYKIKTPELAPKLAAHIQFMKDYIMMTRKVPLNTKPIGALQSANRHRIYQPVQEPSDGDSNSDLNIASPPYRAKL